jgi:cytochrome c oxidase cbb3-type subunit 3
MHEKETSKVTETIKKVVTVLVIGFALFTPLQSFAIDFVHGGESTEKSLWLIVEKSDLYALVVIDLILLFVVIYLKNLFNSFFYMAFPKPVIEKKVRVKKITKVLTDTVAIEDEASILMDHEYDGIQELDNNLPPWWVWGFYMTIVFAVAYMFHYHFLKTGDLQIKAYEKEMVQAQKDVNEYLKSQAMNVDENNVTKLEDPAALATGKTLFTTNCTVCHKEGQGDIGPNLTDKFWLYGNDIKDVFLSVKNGRPNGMPEHTSKLNPIEMQQVVSYVLSMKYKAGREPQGKEYK